MAHKFSKDIFIPKNPTKYIGKKTIIYRSSWEFSFMRFCDNNPSILKWSSESIKIPYRDPLSGKQTIYVPDFLIQYVDKTGVIHVEIIEIKPAKQADISKVGKNRVGQLLYAKNQAKWKAAEIYCKYKGIKFRVITETDMFMNGKGKG